MYILGIKPWPNFLMNTWAYYATLLLAMMFILFFFFLGWTWLETTDINHMGSHNNGSPRRIWCQRILTLQPGISRMCVCVCLCVGKVLLFWWEACQMINLHWTHCVGPFPTQPWSSVAQVCPSVRNANTIVDDLGWNLAFFALLTVLTDIISYNNGKRALQH